MSEPAQLEFLREYGATYGFRRGRARSFARGARASGEDCILFLRERSADDDTVCLWSADPESGSEQLVLDPIRMLQETSDGALVADEVSRLERLNLFGPGVVGYSTDRTGRLACAKVDGRLWLVGLDGDGPPRLVAERVVGTGALAPDGRSVAYVRDAQVWVSDVATLDARRVGPDLGSGARYGGGDGVGLVAGEGIWWSPDSRRVLLVSVDTRTLPQWTLSDLAQPALPPRTFGRVMAGMPGASVQLWLCELDGASVAVDWDRSRYDYVIGCDWGAGGLLVGLESRDQHEICIVEVDARTGRTSPRHTASAEHWLTPTPGLPRVLPDGRAVWSDVRDDTHTLLIGGVAVTPPGLQVESVFGVDGDSVLFAASLDPTETHLWRVDDGELLQLTSRPGVHAGSLAGEALVVVANTLEHEPQVRVRRGGGEIGAIGDVSEDVRLGLRASVITAGERDLRVAMILPTWYDRDRGPLPVLLDPYAGPAMRRVVKARTPELLVSQWFAEQGFCVLVIDGRGTPGRGAEWDWSIEGDLATLPLVDQIDGLHAVAEANPDVLDLGRVGIRGWSYGGFLASVAVLRRPEVFHAAVAGSFLTDQWLYDAYWKERHFGHPDAHRGSYEGCSLIEEAPRLERPLLLMQGLMDENVLPAHVLRFSAALLAADRPHELVVLPGVGHNALTQPIAEHVLRRQARFLTEHVLERTQP